MDEAEGRVTGSGDDGGVSSTFRVGRLAEGWIKCDFGR